MKKTELSDIYNVNTNFFHVFCEMFNSGDIAKLGPYTSIVYFAIKSYVNMNTGKGFPSIDTLAEKTGISRRKIITCVHELTEAGYLDKQQGGKHGNDSNCYTIKEKFLLTDRHGQITATATFDYLPTAIRAAMAELKNFQMTGEVGKIVYIENLVLKMQINNNCNVSNVEKIIQHYEMHQDIELVNKALRRRGKHRNFTPYPEVA